MKTFAKIWLEKEAQLHQAHALRTIKVNHSNEKPSLWSNDYLDLAGQTRLRQAFWDRIGHAVPMGSTGSPLLSGHHRVTRRFSEFLTKAYQKTPIFFGSGWQANTGFINAFSQCCKRRIAWLADEHVHASMISGLLEARHYGARFARFRHQNVRHAREQLERLIDNVDVVILCQESIYSMTGDALDVPAFAQLAQHEKVLWWVDEAHAVGLFGPQGQGLTNQYATRLRPDFLTITFGKALASHGAAILSPKEYASLFTNYARPLIYSTASSPIQTAWTHWIWEQIIKHPRWQKTLFDIVKRVHRVANAIGFSHQSTSPIVPLTLGDNELVLKAKDLWAQKGWTVAAIRPPAVPPKHAQLRLSLTRALTHRHLPSVINLIRETYALCKSNS